jgi:hypothetical protein
MSMKKPESKAKGRALGLVIIIAFIGLACLFTRPMIGRAQDSVYKDSSDPVFQAWTLQADARALANNPLALFQANIYYPNHDTMAYSDNQLSTALIASPLLAITHNPMQTANYMLIFNFFLSALGAYLLTNHLTRNRIAAFAAGVMFAFAAPRLAQVMHLQLSTAGWIPLCLLFLTRYTEKGRWYDAALTGLFLVVQTLATWYYGIMLTIAILLFLLVRVIMRRKTFTLKWASSLLLVLLLAVGIITPFAIPYLQIHSSDPRFTRSVKEVDMFSADVTDFATASQQNWLWGSLTAGLRKGTAKRGGPTERSLFPGLLPLVLGISGAVVLFLKGEGEERFQVRYYVALGGLAVVLCLGTRLHFFGHSVNLPMPYDLFYYVFPGFKVLRVPARFIVLVLLALSVLSAYAIKAGLTWLGKRKSVTLAGLVALGIVGLLLLDLMSVPLSMHKVVSARDFPPVYTWLEQQPGDAPTAELPLAMYNPETFSAGLQYERTWLEREPMRTYFSTLHWKRLLNGYSGFIPDSYYEAVLATAGFPSTESIAWLKATGIQYVIVHASLMDPATLQKIFAWSLKHKDLQPWKVFDQNPKDKDYVYRLR